MKNTLIYLTILLLSYSTAYSQCPGLAAAYDSVFAEPYMIGLQNFSTNATGKLRISTWYWGDGYSYTDTIYSPFGPYHLYAATGTYNIKLVTQWIDSATSSICIDSVTKTFTISSSGGSNLNLIGGSIIQDSVQGVDTPLYRVWLINYDSSANTLTAVDTLDVTGFNPYTSYFFGARPRGKYFIKVKMLNAPTTGIVAIPTYYDSSILWRSATSANHTGYDPGYDIRLRYGTPTTGPGFIGGNISAGANKGTKDGIPDMDVILFDNNKNPIAYTVTDANGDYSFNNIPTGNYIIHPEDMNYATTPGTATVAVNNTTISNVDFLRSEKHKTIMPNTTGITAIEKEVLNIYPNPAKDRVIINMNNPAKTKSDLTIFNMNGQKLYQQSFNGNHTEVDLKGWAKGIYFIKIENENLHLIRKLTLE